MSWPSDSSFSEARGAQTTSVAANCLLPAARCICCDLIATFPLEKAQNSDTNTNGSLILEFHERFVRCTDAELIDLTLIRICSPTR